MLGSKKMFKGTPQIFSFLRGHSLGALLEILIHTYKMKNQSLLSVCNPTYSMKGIDSWIVNP